MFDRRFIHDFDWGLVGLTVLLASLGLLTLYSVVTAGADTALKAIYVKQLIWFSAGLLFMVVSILFNYKLFDRNAPAIYIFCILLLIATLFFGKYVGGSQRWLAWLPFRSLALLYP